MWIYTNEPIFINIVDIWYRASSKSKPTGLLMCTDVDVKKRILSTWREEREAHVLVTTA